MSIQTPNPDGLGVAEGNHTPICQPASKWMALLNDQNVYAPSRTVVARILKDQAGLPADHVLVRDHNSQHDVPFDDDAVVDLADGNVFVTMPRCEYQPRGGCEAPAKRAFFIDDMPEVTLRVDQTGRTLRELFGLTVAVRLFRDYESPQDEPIGLDAPARFVDGPVFYSRRAQAGLTITVNKQTFGPEDGVKAEMTGREIANLITNQPAEVVRLKDGNEMPVGLEVKVTIRGCEEFMVTRCNVAGGFEPPRIEREIERLKENGAEVEFITEPIAAVIFRRVPTRKGYPHLAETDVLVTVPPAYPGSMLDGAYLPAGSPLLGRVVGSSMQPLQAAGQTWQLVSYHPHNGGGGPQWNPALHGFHTYYSEVLVWIQRARI